MTDLHFHLVLLGALFLAVPGVPWRKRLENLGWAVLVTVFFDLFLCFFVVKCAYATKLGAWSLAHYGPFARNAYGLVQHLLDLPFKLGLPLAPLVGVLPGPDDGRDPAGTEALNAKAGAYALTSRPAGGGSIACFARRCSMTQSESSGPSATLRPLRSDS